VIWLLTRPIVWPVRAGALSAQAGYRTGRLFGYRRLFFFGAGFALGLLVAPTTGAELRDRIRERLAGAPMGELPPIGGTTPAHDAPLAGTDDPGALWNDPAPAEGTDPV
jgi:hypothetical protein